MPSANERRIKTLIIFLTILWHGLILYTFFFVTRKESYEPLHIEAKPQIIEYLMNALQQQQNNPTNNALPTTPPALKPTMQQLAQAQVLQQPDDEDGFEQYMLKNAVSYGSYNQGSVVTMGQEGSGGTGTGQDSDRQNKQEEAEKQEPSPEPETNNASDNISKEEAPMSESRSDTQTDSQENQEDGQEQSLVDPTSGMSPAIAQAEEILNNTGSSWITKRQTHTPPHIQSRATTLQPVFHQAHVSSPRKNSSRQLSLADITSSYIKHMRQEQDSTGHYTCTQGGSGQGSISHGVYAPPTGAAALAEQIYASKLYNLLEQSAKAYSSQIYSCSDLEMETIIEVTIEKSGKILDVALKPTLPEKDMERALCLIVKRVGLFPPIPRQFRKQRIVLSIPIHIKSQQGFASYRLLYGLRSA